MRERAGPVSRVPLADSLRGESNRACLRGNAWNYVAVKRLHCAQERELAFLRTTSRDPGPRRLRFPKNWSGSDYVAGGAIPCIPATLCWRGWLVEQGRNATVPCSSLRPSPAPAAGSPLMRSGNAGVVVAHDFSVNYSDLSGQEGRGSAREIVRRDRVLFLAGRLEHKVLFPLKAQSTLQMNYWTDSPTAKEVRREAGREVYVYGNKLHTGRVRKLWYKRTYPARWTSWGGGEHIVVSEAIFLRSKPRGVSRVPQY